MFRRTFLKGSLITTTGLALSAAFGPRVAQGKEQSALPSPIGTWTVNGNGYPGTLVIHSIDAHGNLAHSTIYDQPIIGFWDDRAQKLTFMRLINHDDPSTFQIFTGYLMRGVNDGALALAGSFEGFSGTGAVAERVIYGWYATASSE